MDLISVCFVVNQETTQHDINLFAENILFSGIHCEIIIFNNNCKAVIPEKLGTIYQNNPAIINSWSDCINQLLRIASGNFFFIYFENCIFEKDWLKNLFQTHTQSFLSGCSSIYTELQNLQESHIITKDELLIPVYQTDEFQGCLFFNRQLLESIGGFNERLGAENACNEYLLRTKTIGKINYCIPEMSKITYGKYNDFSGSVFIENDNWKNYFDDINLFHQICYPTTEQKNVLAYIQSTIDKDAIFCRFRGCIIFSKDILSPTDLSTLISISKTHKISFKASSVLNMGIVYSKMIVFIN